MSDRKNGVPNTLTSIPLVDPHAPKPDPSIGDLVKDATAQVSTLVRAEVAREISPIAKPREIHVVPELPKTRSGKIMRRLLRDVAEGRELGDTSTLVDPSVFEAIRASK